MRQHFARDATVRAVKVVTVRLYCPEKGAEWRFFIIKFCISRQNAQDNRRKRCFYRVYDVYLSEVVVRDNHHVPCGEQTMMVCSCPG